MMRTISMFTILYFTLVSCENRRVFEIEGHDPKIVLNSIISTDSIWDVSLSYSKSITDLQSFVKIENAAVKVHNLTNDQTFFLEEKEIGYYSRQLNPVEGHEYELTVEIEDEDVIRASTYVPSVLDVDVLSQAQLDQNGEPVLEIDIEIIDNPNEENFYVWELIPYNYENNDDLPAINLSEEIPAVLTSASESNDNDNENSELVQDSILNIEDTYEYVNEIGNSESNESVNLKSFNSSTYVSDKNLIDGKIHNKLLIKSEALSDINISENVIVSTSEQSLPNGKKPIFQLNVRAVSAELYEYLQTYETYRQNRISNTSIVSPIEIYSNIENGLGIFGGYNQKVFNIY